MGPLKAARASVPTNGLVVSHLGMGDGGRHEGGLAVSEWAAVSAVGVTAGGFGDGGRIGLSNSELDPDLANSEKDLDCCKDVADRSCRVAKLRAPAFVGPCWCSHGCAALRRAGRG